MRSARPFWPPVPDWHTPSLAATSGAGNLFDANLVTPSSLKAASGGAAAAAQALQRRLIKARTVSLNWIFSALGHLGRAAQRGTASPALHHDPQGSWTAPRSFGEFQRRHRPAGLAAALAEECRALSRREAVTTSLKQL